MATVVPALLALDREITMVAPRRTLPTWYLGDKRHRGYPSDHNPDDTPGSKSESQDADSKPEIRAGDYRLPLNAVFTPQQLVEYLVKECRAGRITWIKYIIFDRKIWSASRNWVTQAYNGSNPHDKHFHISCKPETVHENNTKPVGLVAWVASLTKPPKKVTMVDIEGEIPELNQGFSDPLPGLKTNYIKRAQAVLTWLGGYTGKIDGDYGPKMAAAVKEMMKDDKTRTTNNGSKIHEPEWRRLYGIW